MACDYFSLFINHYLFPASFRHDLSQSLGMSGMTDNVKIMYCKWLRARPRQGKFWGLIVSKWNHHLTCRQASAIHHECVITILEYRNSSSDSLTKDRIINSFITNVLCLFDVTDLLRFCQSHDMKRNIFGWFPVKVIPSTSNVCCVTIKACWH